MWQVSVSLAYYSLNSALTSQLVVCEWGKYGEKRKALRVSHPRGIQRGSFFLSLPLRYGVPMMILFALLHWLISQSGFVIRTFEFDWDRTPQPGFTTSGFSIPAALIGK
jgi:hypothetical protein